jgi:hypothetical protein
MAPAAWRDRCVCVCVCVRERERVCVCECCTRQLSDPQFSSARRSRFDARQLHVLRMMSSNEFCPSLMGLLPATGERPFQKPSRATWKLSFVTKLTALTLSMFWCGRFYDSHAVSDDASVIARSEMCEGRLRLYTWAPKCSDVRRFKTPPITGKLQKIYCLHSSYHALKPLFGHYIRRNLQHFLCVIETQIKNNFLYMSISLLLGCREVRERANFVRFALWSEPVSIELSRFATPEIRTSNRHFYNMAGTE